MIGIDREDELDPPRIAKCPQEALQVAGVESFSGSLDVLHDQYYASVDRHKDLGQAGEQFDRIARALDPEGGGEAARWLGRRQPLIRKRQAPKLNRVDVVVESADDPIQRKTW